jgi:Ulp1 family protease
VNQLPLQYHDGDKSNSTVLKDRVNIEPLCAQSLWVTSTFFMTKLRYEPSHHPKIYLLMFRIATIRGTEGPAGVVTWTKDFDIFSKEYIIIPVNRDK